MLVQARIAHVGGEVPAVGAALEAAAHGALADVAPQHIAFVGYTLAAIAQDQPPYGALCFEVLTRNRERLACKFVMLLLSRHGLEGLEPGTCRAQKIGSTLLDSQPANLCAKRRMEAQ
jgi:hypothetical protein